MGIPDPRRDPWYQKKWLVELLSVLPPLLAAAVAALGSLADDEKRTWGWILLAAALWLLMASVVKVLHARALDRERERPKDYEGLRAALHVLYAAARARAGLDPETQDSTLRATIHRVLPPPRGKKGPEELEQILPYLGDPHAAAGRTFSIRSGIIGRAVREKAAFAAERVNDDHEGFVQELVKEWAFTHADARALRQDRRSWMAVPIFGTRKTVIGAVHLDSSLPDLFTAEVRQVVTDCCAGLTNFTDEVYR